MRARDLARHLVAPWMIVMPARAIVRNPSSGSPNARRCGARPPPRRLTFIFLQDNLPGRTGDPPHLSFQPETAKDACVERDGEKARGNA